MRIEQSYPTPIFGVSTLAPRNRPRGYATEQINFRSDPVNKLTRRPASQWAAKVTESPTEKLLTHTYVRDDVTYRLVVNTVTGEIKGYKDADEVVVEGALGDYLGANLEFSSIEHDTYVLNRDVEVAMLPDTDEDTIQRVTHVNVTSALNYSESVKLNITNAEGNLYSVTYTVPSLGTSEPNYDAADRARATRQVAASLASKIGTQLDVVNTLNTSIGASADANYPTYITLQPNGQAIKNVWTNVKINTQTGTEYRWMYVSSTYNWNPDSDTVIRYNNSGSASIYDSGAGTTGAVPNVRAVSLGSTVAIWSTTQDEWVHVEVENGQGERTTVAINNTVQNTDGLPLFAKAGTRIQVRPDPTSEKGIYYLQAERTADEPSGAELEEVVWSEDRSPDQPHSLDNTTMPHKISFDGEKFVISTEEYKSRQSGDDDTCKVPSFVEQTITTLSYFQKRLVFAYNNEVQMSESDDPLNFWRQSAVQLLVSDTVNIASSDLGVDKLLHLIPHNRDLLCIASNSQFKIAGSEAVTPETVSMALTTRYEAQAGVRPVSMGNSVFFPVDYGDSSGLQEYTGEKDTNQDFAKPITNHVIGLLKGKIEIMKASPNLEMIALTTSDTPANQIFIYEQYTKNDGSVGQRSWSTWTLPEGETILDMDFRKNSLFILSDNGTNVDAKFIAMYSRATTSPDDVYLDNMLILPTDGNSVTLPDDYPYQDLVVVRGTGTQYALNLTEFTRVGQVLTFKQSIGEGYVYIGSTYESTYEPTRPFKYDDDGSVITTDRLRPAKYVISLVDTNKLKFKIKSRYSDITEQVFDARFVSQSQIGVVDTYTGDWKFSFSQNADFATPVLYCDNHLASTITDISWDGQYHQSTQRMK